MSEQLAQLEKKGGGGIGALHSFDSKIQHATSSLSSTESYQAPISGILVANMMVSDGGSNRDNYISVNGTRICTVVWTVSEGRCAAVVPISQGDTISVTYNVARTNGWGTCGYAYSLDYFN